MDLTTVVMIFFCEFVNNGAMVGGAIFMNGGTLVVVASSFRGNSAARCCLLGNRLVGQTRQTIV